MYSSMKCSESESCSISFFTVLHINFHYETVLRRKNCNNIDIGIGRKCVHNRGFVQKKYYEND